ncbi:MAG: transglutaminase family protein [Flavobacteriales bacterium]|jgi:hypothetical protein|nr:transglutaminase family protein [Flavobacteriales bacterium]
MSTTPTNDQSGRVQQPAVVRGLQDRLAHAVVVYVVALLLSLPLFIIIDAFVPEWIVPVGGGIRIDQPLVFLAVLMAFAILVGRLRAWLYPALLLALLVLSITTVTGIYPFGRAYEAYADLLRRLQETAAGIPMAADRARPFHDADRLRALIDPADPVLRAAAVRMATTHFPAVKVRDNEHTLVQAFSIFRSINGTWRYVSDVKGGEYFATPQESLELMAGDCDDHALLMAACIKAIGGEVRLVRTTGHVYPELKIGDDAAMERAAMLIRKQLFTKEVGEAPLYHHTDSDGQHWINLDYTRAYPGGELMNEKIIGILAL